MTLASLESAGAGYERFQGRWSRLWVPALLAAAGVVPGTHVLEVAAGSGQATQAAASLAGTSGRVIATDLSIEMVRAARGAVVTAPAPPVAFAAMDGQQLAARDESIDALVCLFGLMLFADPVAGLAEFHRVLRPGGRVALAVWAEPERAPFPGVVVEVLVRHLPGLKRELEATFALADESGLETLLRDSAFEDVSVVRESRPIKFETFDDLWGSIEEGSLAAAALRKLPAVVQRAVRHEMRMRVAAFETQGWLVMDCEALLATGRRSAG